VLSLELDAVPELVTPHEADALGSGAGVGARRLVGELECRRGCLEDRSRGLLGRLEVLPRPRHAKDRRSAKDADETDRLDHAIYIGCSDIDNEY
jgi:hypothetical protein